MTPDEAVEVLKELRFWIKGAGTPEERVPPPQAQADEAIRVVLEERKDCERDHPPEPWASELTRRAEKAEAEVEQLRDALEWLRDWAKTDPDAPGTLSASDVAVNALKGEEE